MCFENQFWAVQWLGLHAFTAKGQGWISGLGTKILQDAWHNQKKKKNHSNSKIKKYMVSELSTVFGRSVLLFLPGSSLEPEVDFNPLSIKQQKTQEKSSYQLSLHTHSSQLYPSQYNKERKKKTLYFLL